MSELLALLTAIALALTVIIIYRIIRKKMFCGIQWLFPSSFLIGYLLTYWTYDDCDYWGMIKNTLLYAFIVIMFIVNTKVIKYAIKSRLEHGHKFLSDFKEMYNDAKSSFAKNRKTPKDKSNKENNEDDKNNENKEGDINVDTK